MENTFLHKKLCQMPKAICVLVRTTEWGGQGEDKEGYKMISWDENSQGETGVKDNEFSLSLFVWDAWQDTHANAARKWRGGYNLGRTARQKYYIGSYLRIWRKDPLQRGRGEVQNHVWGSYKMLKEAEKKPPETRQEPPGDVPWAQGRGVQPTGELSLASRATKSSFE